MFLPLLVIMTNVINMEAVGTLKRVFHIFTKNILQNGFFSGSSPYELHFGM